MSVITNQLNTYDIKGIREELSNVIYNISPTETPFMSNAGRASADAVFTEWQIDSLAAPDGNNAQLEGDDIATFQTQGVTSRIGNYCQISRKTALVGGTTEAVKKAGRASEMAYQLSKRSAEIKRDMETILLSNQAAVAGATATARKTGSVLAFLVSNVKGTAAAGALGAGGANPPALTAGAPTTARTDGTQAAISEANLKLVMQACWTAGGTPDTVMCGATNKVNISAFAGVATKTFYQSAVKTTAIIGAADVYVSDFGTFSIVPNRFQRSRDVFVLDFDYWKIAYLRGFRTIPLAKTGDAEKRLLLVEYALQSNNEGASGVLVDCS